MTTPPAMHPLRFQPLFKHAIWGGRRLETILGKSLDGTADDPDRADWAESWEIVDHGEDQSVVAAGALSGATLGGLTRERGEELLGRHAPRSQFPLLLKFLDANRNLSVQVHPNDEQGARLDPPDLGKTEAWVVLHAEPGSKIYAGLKRGFDREALAREVHRGTTEMCLHAFEPSAGDCVFIPAGTVHAIGAGLVIAEIQQSSDTTFRLFDWNRVGADGQPRQLHIEESLEVIDFDRGPVNPQTPQPTDQPGRTRLVTCDKFVLDRIHGDQPWSVGGDDGCHLVAVVEGAAKIQGDPAETPLRMGESMLLPAACGAVEVTPQGATTVLDMHLP